MKQKQLPPNEVTMTAEEYKKAINKLRLSQVRAGEFFGFSDRQGQRMANGEAELLPAVIHLIRLMLKYKIKPTQLDKRLIGNTLDDLPA
jgi:hypothetical protein